MSNKLSSKLDPGRVRVWRRSHEIPQARLAAALGCSQDHLSKFERGLAELGETEVALLAAIVGFSETEPQP